MPVPLRIFVLGHRGMLGHVVARYLQGAGHDVITTEMRYTGVPRDPLIETVRDSGCAWIVNAAGRIKQKSADPADLLLVNSQLPAHLKMRLAPNQKVIHASTDCVFSGTHGAYEVFEEPDAEDVYGFSKVLGEASAQAGRFQVLRTSIIGPGQEDASGLMGWFLSQKGPVNGYVNHLWNGITTLEWAKVALEIMEGRLNCDRPVVQAGVLPALSKCELLRLISETWHHSITVTPMEAPEKVDRTLQPQILRPALRNQLREFHEWYRASWVPDGSPVGRSNPKAVRS